MEASTLHAPAALRPRLSVGPALLKLRSDEQLVALFRAGNEDAFQVIHERYKVRLTAYCRQMLSGSRSDAEDASQDVFLKAFRALRSDDRPVSLRAWLYRVAHNRCIDQIRRPTPASEDVFDMARGPIADPVAQTERREKLARLVDDIGRLPEAQRSALLMREMDGLSYQELADALDVTVPAIKSLLVRARIGLVESIEARDTACVEIRDDLVRSFDKGVRASGLARRHLRDCAGCRDYRDGLRTTQQAINSLVPGQGPLSVIAKLLGLGGSSGAAAAGSTAAIGGGTVAAGGASLVGGGAAGVTACKVAAAVVCSAVAITTGVGHQVERAVVHSGAAGSTSGTSGTEARSAHAAIASPSETVTGQRRHGVTASAGVHGVTGGTPASRRAAHHGGVRSRVASAPITPDSDVYGSSSTSTSTATAAAPAAEEDPSNAVIDPADPSTDGSSSTGSGNVVSTTVSTVTDATGTGSTTSGSTTGSTGSSSSSTTQATSGSSPSSGSTSGTSSSSNSSSTGSATPTTGTGSTTSGTTTSGSTTSGSTISGSTATTTSSAKNR